MRARLRQLASVILRVIGAPDYDAYVSHCRRHHPALQPLARDAWLRERLDARYNRPGSRCC